MERYESIVVAQPGLSEEEFDSLRESFAQVIAGNGGVVSRSESWGKRRLAYPVAKHQEGYYGFFLFEGSGVLVKELERRYRLNEQVIRFLTVTAPPEGAKLAGSPDFAARPGEADRPGGERPEGAFAPIGEEIPAGAVPGEEE